jgi:hypothetical protein
LGLDGEVLMEKVYLKNGAAVNLVKQIDNDNFIVEPALIFYDHEGNEDYEWGDRIVVNKIYRTPPKEVIQKDYLDLLENITAKTGDLQKINAELFKAERAISKIKSQKTDLEKMIINRSELKTAKSITVFNTDSAAPCTLSEKEKRYLKIQLTISVIDGEETAFSCKWYGEEWSSNNRVDLKYGFLCDMPDDDIIALAKKRSVDIFKDGENSYTLKHTDDRYLADSVIEIKKPLIEKDKTNKLENLMKKISDAEENVKILRAELKNK